jgi:phosphatidylglycerophosphatase A
MLRAIATVGYVGCLPRVGGVVAAAAGLAVATAVFLSTFDGLWVLAAWCAAFAAAAWALPRALASDAIDDGEIVVDRFAGVWLAAAPVIPATALALQIGPLALLAVLAVPLALFHLILAGPLRRMGTSPRMWLRMGDDLIAGLLAMIAALAAMAALLTRLGGVPA